MQKLIFSYKKKSFFLIFFKKSLLFKIKKTKTKIKLKTKIGKEFLKLVDKHFPKDGPLNKIFNRNIIKISYSCMPNIDSEITKSNLKVIDESKNEKNNKTTCNCRIKALCPVEGKCLTKSVIYKATVTYNIKKQFYIGSNARNFKTRYYEHMHSFNIKS